jgi:ABC-type Fe2+-enterobactin transport system substrate-binding protein
MAVNKHAMTKEGAIIAITRQQVADSGGKPPKAIHKGFIDAYMNLEDKKLEELYQKTFGIELVIVKYKRDVEES